MADHELLDHGTLRERLKGFGSNGRMRVVLVEPSATGRTALVTWLRDLGIEVAPFRDPHVAFLFLLVRLEEVDGVLVNGDDAPQTSRLLRRLEMLPAPVAVVTYSSRDPGRASAMAIAGGHAIHRVAPCAASAGEPGAWRRR
jgi:hypothetical protein